MTSAKLMQAKEAADVLKQALVGHVAPITVADASTTSGLGLVDTQTGLQWLVSEYRGHLSATESGELLYQFPDGFIKPWETETWLGKAWRKTKQFFSGTAQFVARAWLTWAIIFYAGLFAILLIALLSRGGDGDKGGEGVAGLGRVLFHLIIESLYWTFHPFSPFYIRSAKSSKTGSFYEKVNGFFFGKKIKEEDPRTMERKILAQIRACQGRIGLIDVMTVTGLSRANSEYLMCKLMLDYEGEISVSDDGILIWTFEKMRQTADSNQPHIAPAAAWHSPKEAPTFSGNSPWTDFLIGGLNFFNLVMSSVAILAGVTWERLWHLVGGLPPELLPPVDGLPLLLGWVPFIFSIFLFSFPVGRLFRQRREKREIAKENGKRGILRGILEKITFNGVSESALKESWEAVAQSEPSSDDLNEIVAQLGGEPEADEDGSIRYRFRDLEAEVAALEKERAAASKEEEEIGEVVFSSAS
jgi:hypothetical protein